MKRTRQDLLKGIDGARFLRRAAREMDQLGRANARIVEVDSRAHVYAPRITEIFYLDAQLADGSWVARSTEDIAGQGVLSVRRVLRENLLPALTVQAIEKLVRGGIYNEYEPAKRFVLDDCRFRYAGKVERFDA